MRIFSFSFLVLDYILLKKKYFKSCRNSLLDFEGEVGGREGRGGRERRERWEGEKGEMGEEGGGRSKNEIIDWDCLSRIRPDQYHLRDHPCGVTLWLLIGGQLVLLP